MLFRSVKGNKIEQIDGNYELHVKNNYSLSVEGQSTLNSSGDMNIGAGGVLGGGVFLNTGELLHLMGDLQVDGEVRADKVTADTRIDAGLGMSCGGSGFVTSGGINVGLHISAPDTPMLAPSVPAIPGWIMASGTITAPFGVFNLMTAILMTDLVNTHIYDMHIHPTPKGPSGPPMMPMI